MGYQALLFCPDEKAARTVTQVLTDLDFAVVPCTEPFAAVKQLMAERFDAIVVDCDNEQNATLLFKSARTAANNQSSLAVAVVEGQAGVARAFRIGANLVLTKPINIEQAKGTLRVARGLLRKNEAAKPANSAANLKPEAPTQRTPRPFPIAGVSGMAPFESGTGPSISTHQIALLATTGSAGSDVSHAAESLQSHEVRPASTTIATQISEAKIVPPSPVEVKPQIHSHAGFSRPGGAGGAASAPAPALEPSLSVASENGSRVMPMLSSPEVAAHENAAGDKLPVTSEVTSSGVKSASGSKIALVGMAAIILLAAGGYEAWLQWGRANAGTNTPVQLAARPAVAPVTIAAPNANAISNSSPANSAASPKTATGKSFISTATGARFDNSKTTQDRSSALDSDKASPSALRGNLPSTKGAPRPIVIKNDVTAANAASVDAPPVSINVMVETSNHSQLPGLINSSQAPTPVLQTVSVSQGVSQGLLIKKAQPTYPSNALRMHVEGPVELVATISKSGDISAVKILSGDPQLARSAADAVRQWKYKPYLLNGTPVEIQTQITVNFKLPR